MVIRAMSTMIKFLENDPIYKSLESSRESVRKMNWQIFELKAGHNAMFTHPKETLNLLMKICN